ncbi:MAG: hypothetical protein ACK559_37615, partial [bacterium]
MRGEEQKTHLDFRLDLGEDPRRALLRIEDHVVHVVQLRAQVLPQVGQRSCQLLLLSCRLAAAAASCLRAPCRRGAASGRTGRAPHVELDAQHGDV